MRSCTAPYALLHSTANKYYCCSMLTHTRRVVRASQTASVAKKIKTDLAGCCGATTDEPVAMWHHCTIANGKQEAAVTSARRNNSFMQCDDDVTASSTHHALSYGTGSLVTAVNTCATGQAARNRRCHNMPNCLPQFPGAFCSLVQRTSLERERPFVIFGKYSISFVSLCDMLSKYSSPFTLAFTTTHTTNW
jgi:hypothetical protein